ncbi:MAG: PqqD family protein [Bacteroidales bacterium]|nr:PqqD family protein [Bacteroidales bacterium]
MKIKKSIAVSETGFVFDPTTGESFSLNEIGIEYLNRLKEGVEKDEIKKEILEKYDVDEMTFESSFNDFINMLYAYQLLEKND